MKKLFAQTMRGFTLLELMTVVFIISIMAGVALPLVGKYLKKSKTSEASLNLRKIYDGEMSYYQEERTDAQGTVISKRFVGLSPQPAIPSKDKQSGSFDSEDWAAIKFAPDGPVLFSYSVIASGTGTNAQFTARANGDIDGDGNTSLFERVGGVDSTGEISGGGAIYQLDELE